MLKKILFVSIISIISIITLLYFIFKFYINPKVNPWVVGSFVSSVHRYLQDYCKENPDILPILLDENFSLFSDSDYQYLNNEEICWRHFDSGSLSRKAGEILFDAWGNRILIAVRRNENKQLEFFVWSKGPDGINGTEDDIKSIDYEIDVTNIKKQIKFFREVK